LVICPFGLTEPERIAEENVMLEAPEVLTPGAEAARALGTVSAKKMATGASRERNGRRVARMVSI
jgi:hypothetical protein